MIETFDDLIKEYTTISHSSTIKWEARNDIWNYAARCYMLCEWDCISCVYKLILESDCYVSLLR